MDDARSARARSQCQALLVPYRISVDLRGEATIYVGNRACENQNEVDAAIYFLEHPLADLGGREATDEFIRYSNEISEKLIARSAAFFSAERGDHALN